MQKKWFVKLVSLAASASMVFGAMTVNTLADNEAPIDTSAAVDLELDANGQFNGEIPSEGDSVIYRIDPDNYSLFSFKVVGTMQYDPVITLYEVWDSGSVHEVASNDNTKALQYQNMSGTAYLERLLDPSRTYYLEIHETQDFGLGGNPFVVDSISYSMSYQLRGETETVELSSPQDSAYVLPYDESDHCDVTLNLIPSKEMDSSWEADIHTRWYCSSASYSGSPAFFSNDETSIRISDDRNVSYACNIYCAADSADEYVGDLTVQFNVKFQNELSFAENFRVVAYPAGSDFTLTAPAVHTSLNNEISYAWRPSSGLTNITADTQSVDITGLSAFSTYSIEESDVYGNSVYSGMFIFPVSDSVATLDINTTVNKTTHTAREYSVYSITPEYTGNYTLATTSVTSGNPYYAVFDSDLNLIDADPLTNDNNYSIGLLDDAIISMTNDGTPEFSTELSLTEGKTYYIFVKGLDDELTQFGFSLSFDVPENGNGGSTNPTSAPTTEPTTAPTTEPTTAPTTEPTTAPTTEPTTAPTTAPTGEPTSAPATTPAIPTDIPVTPTTETGVAGFVERLYTVALGRPSDPVGKADWIAAVTERGSTGADCARGFLYSPEFLNKALSNEDFVTVLYRTFFDRLPDQEGFNAWVHALETGTPKQEIIEGFINSTEWANLCLFYGIRNGGTGVPNITVEPNQKTIDFCTRLYTTCLGRAADQDGLMAWARQLANQRDTGTGAAHGFFFSSEFINQNVSNEEYVRRLYLTFMDREPEAEGYNAWVTLLDTGTSREEVFNGFADSIEFTRICADYGIIR